MNLSKAWGIGFCVLFVTSLQAEQQATPVKTQPLSKLVSAQHFDVPAEVVALKRPKLAAQANGELQRLHVIVGDQLSEGQLIAEIDCKQPQLLMAIAEAELVRAKAQQVFAREQLQRANALSKKKSLSAELLGQRRLELKTANSQRSLAESELQRSQLSVDHCQLKAPFAGVVVSRLASEGDYLTIGMPVIELLQPRGDVSAALSPSDVLQLKQSMQADYVSEGGRYPVKLRVILPLLDSVSRTQEARLEFAKTDALIGSSGRLQWQGNSRVIDGRYLSRYQKKLGIWLVKQNKAVFHPLPHALAGRPARVGLPEDTQIITQGFYRLTQGEAITGQAQ